MLKKEFPKAFFITYRDLRITEVIVPKEARIYYIVQSATNNSYKYHIVSEKFPFSTEASWKAHYYVIGPNNEEYELYYLYYDYPVRVFSDVFYKRHKLILIILRRIGTKRVLIIFLVKAPCWNCKWYIEKIYNTLTKTSPEYYYTVIEHMLKFLKARKHYIPIAPEEVMREIRGEK